jgi:acid phosphatase
MKSHVLAILATAIGSVTAQEYYAYTATSTADVYAAQATAKTLSPVSNVKGKAFDRIAIIWNENTDYDLAIGDRK